MQRLPETLEFLSRPPLWTAAVPTDGIGGLSVADGQLLVTARDASDQKDLLIAFDAASGRRLWAYAEDAPSNLDYGNSPRATPAIAEGVVVHLGATGKLTGLDRQSGLALWSIDCVRRFGCEVSTWGFCGSPLIHDRVVYAQVADRPSLIAVDLFDGTLKWTVDGNSAAYSSLVLSADRTSLIGVDEVGYFERRLSDGRLVWSGERKWSGDFGVPAPVLVDGGLVFVGENNGVLFKADADDKLISVDDKLLPDSHTPVAVGEDVLIAYEGIHRIHSKTGKRRWSVAAGLAEGYVSIIADDQRLMAWDQSGKVVLIDHAEGRLLDHATLSRDPVRTLSHPAVVGDRIWVRVGREIRCYRM